MSKIVYLFGAGASFGKRAADDKNEILEGLPIVSEFPVQIDRLVEKIQNQKFSLPASQQGTSDESKKLIDELKWLKESSEKHQTVDTFAKKLRVSEGHNNDYDRLKNAISVFLTLMQLFNKPDSRYDAFFANILGNSYYKLPENVSILSWNYDCQFEIAHAAYSKRQSLNAIWDDLNIKGKTTKSRNDNYIPFSITKLNGTALMFEDNGSFDSTFFDAFFNRQGMSEISYVTTAYIDTLNSKNVRNALSFAWEGCDTEFEKLYISKAIDAEILVIIGYSFPFFNREVDREIIRNMVNLKKVYIQDPFCEYVKDSFEAVLSEEQLEKVVSGQIKIVFKKSCSQFLIPNEM